tara:strand:- start:34 stop:561 length:528 start_codon:yes stop_codon:yes gene_type:complete
MYRLKQTSVTSKFYQWIWMTEVTKFKTMCPYFWKYTLTIVFLPLILPLKLIAMVLPKSERMSNIAGYVGKSKVVKATSYLFEPNAFWNSLGFIFKWLFIITISVVLISGVSMLLYGFYINPIGGLAFTGAISIILMTLYLFFHYEVFETIWRPFKLFGNMVYSLYKKVCPLISWN